MSIVRIALRKACVEALRGKTLAGDAVLDSEIGAISVDEYGRTVVSGNKPFVAIYTDQATATVQHVRDLNENGDTVLILQMGVADTMVVTEPDPENPGAVRNVVVPSVPDASGGFEVVLDILSRQILSTLSHGSGEFAEIWRGLVASVRKIERRCLASAETGQRFAAHQIAISCSLLPDPVDEDDLDPKVPLARFFERYAALGSEEAELVGVLQDLIVGPASAASVVSRKLGLTGDEAVSAFGVDMIGDELAGIEIAVGGRPAAEVGDV
jgi:hypothetical protein